MNKQTFFDRDHTHYYIDDLEAIATYCKERHPEDVKHILRVADEVCEHYFLFDLKWDMERTYEPVIFGDEIDWNYMPGDDPEFIWQFNRHRYFICLGQAYALTQDEKYAKTFTELVRDWIQKVPLTEENKKGPWRSLETGLRGENWNKALRYFIDSPYITDEFIDVFYNSMIEHAEHIIASHSPYRYMSNWGVIENHGLFEIAMMLPQSEETKKYADMALKNLEIEARMQIFEDGVQWEQSPMYHNEVLHCFYDVMILGRRNKVELPEALTDAVRRMVYANLAWKKPNHHQIMMGDSDDTDIRDLISVGAYLYNDPVMKFGGFEYLDYESIWDLGIEAGKTYEALEMRKPDFTSCYLKDSGNTYMRSSWEENANFLHLHCGTLGAGHGHSDKLHIDLVIEGEDVLMDAGRFTYVAGPKRYEFKDPTAHNTITVDNQFFTVCKDSWECSKLSQPVKQGFTQKDKYEFAEAGHLGYMDMKEGVFVNRKVIYIKPDIYILVDEMYTGGDHVYQQYFHFNNLGEVQKASDQVTYKGEKAEANFYFLTPELQIEETISRLSRNYNEAEENTCIKTELEGKGFASMITVIHGGKIGQLPDIKLEKLPVKSALKGSYYPDYMAEAIKIEVEAQTYVVVICHQEVNTPTDLVEVDGCMGYGSMIVFDKNEDHLVGNVLCW